MNDYIVPMESDYTNLLNVEIDFLFKGLLLNTFTIQKVVCNPLLYQIPKRGFVFTCEIKWTNELLAPRGCENSWDMDELTLNHLSESGEASNPSFPGFLFKIKTSPKQLSKKATNGK